MLLLPLYHHCVSFGRPIASIEQSLWRPLYLHLATTATLEPPWQWFCFHSASAGPVVPLQQFWWFKEGTRVVLQQLHRNRTFWVWVTTECPDNFSGCSKVAWRLQPCVKGALPLYVGLLFLKSILNESWSVSLTQRRIVFLDYVYTYRWYLLYLYIYITTWVL